MEQHTHPPYVRILQCIVKARSLFGVQAQCLSRRLTPAVQLYVKKQTFLIRMGFFQTLHLLHGAFLFLGGFWRQGIGHYPVDF